LKLDGTGIAQAPEPGRLAARFIRIRTGFTARSRDTGIYDMVRFVLGLLTVLLPCFSHAVAREDAHPLKVLFLGDRGHHRPADRAAQLVPVLASRGIDVTYTEDMTSLSPINLSKYDAVLIYANTTEISREQEQALLGYVRGGGGFVPVHCASYCFLNSPAYIALVGAQFQRHGMAEFDTNVVDRAHAIMKGLEPFHTRDETYVHTKHNDQARHVLQTRTEGSAQEPWTWVREEGKGRVFYTAYGHDTATWGQPGFHDLIERGIRWAANKGEVFDSRPRVPSGLKPFEYGDAGASIPNYVASQRWGTEGAPIRKMQKPVDPVESMKHIAVPGDFEVQLFAAEPDISKPISMAFDHRGRLWVVETRDYPNEMQPAGKGRDRIKICEDTNGDGRADKFTVFAETLSIPTSLAFAGGGVVIHQAPETLFLKDTDGDDKADERRVLFRGWGTSDTHAGPSNLRYGMDNWLYGIVGYSSFRGEVGGEHLEFHQGLYRFKPDGSKLEFLRSTSNNSWGVGLSEEGLVFGSTANGCPSVFMPIPNRYYEAVRGAAPRVLRNIADSNRFFPITDKVRQVDYHGGFTAAAGHALYTARTYPRVYWNSAAFVSEPTGHLVATFALERRGSDYASHNAWNLVASDDEWTAPVQAEVGPDGQVWIIDWYNFIVQHNPTPQGFRTGKGAAYETPLRDKTHGRIYRIVSKSGKPTPPVHLDPRDASSLVAGLKSTNMLWRMHAQRLLVERGNRDIVPALVALVNDRSVDEIGLNTAAIHALGALHGLGALSVKDADGPAVAAATSALKHASAGVRRNALAFLPRDEATTRAIVAARSPVDADAQVKLAAFLALSELPRSQAAAELIAEALNDSSAAEDRNLVDAIVMAAAAHDREFLAVISKHSPSGSRAARDVAADIIRRVSEHYARGGPEATVASLLPALAAAEAGVSSAVISGLATGWPKGMRVRLTDDADKALSALLPKLAAASRTSLVNLAGRWGSKAFERDSAALASALLATVKDESKSDDTRAEAARQLVEFRPQDVDSARALLDLVTPRVSGKLSAELFSAAARADSAELSPLLTERLGTLTPTARAEAIRALLSRSERAGALIDAIESGSVTLGELSLDQKQALAAHPNSAVAARAKQLLARGGGLPDADRQKVIDTLAPTVLKGGDSARGKQVFTQQCAKCHAHSGEGGKVGPDLTGMSVHPREELLTHILDPSRSVEGNFFQYAVATTDGRVLNGLLAAETKTSLELVDTEGKTQTISRSDVEQIIASKKSLMPEGFEKQIPAEGLADLLAFLTQRGKYVPLDLRKVATIVSTQGMFYAKDSAAERLVFPDWSPKAFQGIPFHLVDPQGGRVPNVVMLYGPQGAFPPTMPRVVTLPCHAPAKAIHLLSGVSGWGAQDSGTTPTVSMIVRIHYADGSTEDHSLQNGVHFADYIRRVDVPGSQLAFMLRGRQVRYLAVQPKKTASIDRIELVKGPDDTAPVVVAVTVEVAD
jgi:putative membrane-bound dehydrogenase-like protein